MIINKKGFIPLDILNSVNEYSYNETLCILAQYTGTTDEDRARNDLHTFSLLSENKWNNAKKACMDALCLTDWFYTSKQSPYLFFPSKTKIAMGTPVLFVAAAAGPILGTLLFIGIISSNPAILIGIAIGLAALSAFGIILALTGVAENGNQLEQSFHS